MRDRRALDRVRLLLACLVVGCLAVPAATAADTPAIKAKRAQAKQVVAEINAIDERLSIVTEQYDGARFHLAAIQGRLVKEKASLAQAQAQNKRAQDRVAALLVQLYEQRRPTALEAILGADSIEGIINATDAESVIAKSDRAVAEEADAARTRLERVVTSLRRDRAGAAKTLHQLQVSRANVEAGLADRQRLLNSVQGQLAHLEAVERARQERLAALARARLKAEEAAAARARARAAQAARAAAAAAVAAAAHQRMLANQHAAATAAAATSSTPSTVASTAAPAPAPAPVPAATDTTSIAPVPTPTIPATLPTGHPQAAQIALGYIGVPYLWGGSSPSGFDCSGLVSFVYAQLGISLPHFAAAQYGLGAPVPRDQLQPGDLVFFDNLDHVGIYIGNDEFVDAPHTGTFVRIDSLAQGWYNSRYVGARRI